MSEHVHRFRPEELGLTEADRPAAPPAHPSAQTGSGVPPGAPDGAVPGDGSGRAPDLPPVAWRPPPSPVGRRVSVHALGQYVYCPRAAVLADERGDARDPDEAPPRLDYLPCYELARIDEAIARQLDRLLGAVVLVGGLVVLALRGWWDPGSTLFVPSFALLGPAVWWLLSVVEALARLAARRRAALTAQADAPPPEVTVVTHVHWWGLLRAGLEPYEPRQPYRHPSLPLGGAPWRVLQRGGLQVPVVKSGGKRLGPRAGSVYAKHELRLAAYALLLEADGHTVAPYGVVLRDGTTQGLAVPLSAETKRSAARRAQELVDLVTRWRARLADPPAPREASRCGGCHHGAPEAVSAREARRLAAEGPLLLLRGVKGDLHHCACGDRFGAAPPHNKTLRKGLAPVVG